MSRRTNIKVRASNTESGHRFYTSDMSYREQMRTPTDKGQDNQIQIPHSERKKPYRADSYGEMEHFREPPSGISWGYPGYPGWGITFPDYPWEQPDGVPDADAAGGFVIFFAWTSDCYCPGETICGYMDSTQKIVGMSLAFPALHDAISLVSSGGNFCIETEEDASQSIGINVEMVAEVNGREIQGWNYVLIQQCPDDDCAADCDPTARIEYTTIQMAVNEQQTFTAVIDGVPVTTGTYEWELVDNGGGSLSVSGEASVLYTAPATNANCLDNPTINLKCDGVTLHSLKIAVNADTGKVNCAVAQGFATQSGDFCASLGFECPHNCCCECIYRFYWCDGTKVKGGSCAWDGDNWGPADYPKGSPWDNPIDCEGTGCSEHDDCVGSCVNDLKDMRTGAMKTAGCCSWRDLYYG